MLRFPTGDTERALATSQTLACALAVRSHVVLPVPWEAGPVVAVPITPGETTGPGRCSDTPKSSQLQYTLVSPTPSPLPQFDLEPGTRDGTDLKMKAD